MGVSSTELRDDSASRTFEADDCRIADIIQRISSARSDPVEKLQARMAGVLRDLLEYSIFQFRAQEKFMRSIRFEGYADHAEMHKDFVRRLREHMTLYTSGKRIEASLLAFLREWAAGHVALADSRLSEIARLQGVPPSHS